MHERLTEAAAQALKQEVPLIEAALLRIRAALNEDSTECAHCHLRLKAANRDCQLAETLKSARHKLRRWEAEAGGRKAP